jgi:hypothetical protein
VILKWTLALVVVVASGCRGIVGIEELSTGGDASDSSTGGGSSGGSAGVGAGGTGSTGGAGTGGQGGTSGPYRLANVNGVEAVTLDATLAYFATWSGSVYSIPKLDTGQSSPQPLLSGEGSIRNLVLVGNELYFTWVTTNQPTGGISKLPLSSTQSSVVVPALTEPNGLAFLDGKLYFASVDTIYSAPLDGSSAPVAELPIASGADLTGLARGDGSWFVGGYDTQVLYRDAALFATEQSDIVGVATDGTHVYWTRQYASDVFRAPFDDGTAIELRADEIGKSQAFGIAVDDQNVYVATEVGLYRAPK